MDELSWQFWKGWGFKQESSNLDLGSC